MSLSVISNSFLEKCLFMSFVHFLIEFFCLRFLYTVSYSLVRSVVFKCFLPACILSFHLFTSSFTDQKLKILLGSSVSMDHVLKLGKILWQSMYIGILYFFSKSFIYSTFTFTPISIWVISVRIRHRSTIECLEVSSCFDHLGIQDRNHKISLCGTCFMIYFFLWYISLGCCHSFFPLNCFIGPRFSAFHGRILENSGLCLTDI